MSDDIVTRLRDIEGGYGFRAICREAADQIERLREMLRLEREECAACAIDRRETQWERDEARRELCIALGKDHFAFTALPGEHNHFNAARDRGWDCFGEEP